MSLLAASTGSLFIPQGHGALENAVGWMTGTLLGSIATALCIIAIAILGLMMLTGRFPVRQGLRVILGCFLLLGAPVVAAAFGGIWQQASSPPPAPSIAVSEPDPRADLPPADYDPYAGASLRRD